MNYVYVLLLGIILSAMVTNSNVQNELLKEKLRRNAETGAMIKEQMDELAKAQNLYYKTYKKYPTDIAELISKGFLRANFETAMLSKNIKLDANNTIQAINPKNDAIKAYTDAHQNMVNSRDMKEKVTHAQGESIESRIEEF
jgi:mannitol-specific phosphotransferase system IIBC component